ncbi:MAG: LamG domain-containing protein, partial [Phycisphaeraceae bacterium]|nr:LamG domain-containing protein [Phycisphaeraceae bacterium]
NPDTDQAILVAEGFYTGPGNTDLDFQGKAIRLYGSGPEICEIFCGDQFRALYFHSGEDANSVVDGFTISGGAAVIGSAVYCEGASPTLANCIINGNGSSDIWTSDQLNLQGTVTIQFGVLEGPGVVQLQSGAVLQLQGCPIACSIVGTGRMEVLSGDATTLTGSSIVDLNIAAEGDRSIVCSGKLVVREDAIVQNTSIEIAKAGKVTAVDSGSLLNCKIYAASDSALTLDSQTHTGSLAETEIFVTLSEDTNYEILGQIYCSDPEDPICGPGAHQLISVPALDASTLTLSRLELGPNVKVTLSDHFRDQAGNPYDVLYVRDLVLGEGAQLNLAGQRLYYETVIADPGQIVDLKVYTSQLAKVNLGDSNTFNNDVTTNNTLEQTFVSLVDVPEIAPEPVMYLQDHGNVSARAKTYLGRFSEDQVIVDFSYLFNSDQPDAVLEVYLSDEEGLLPLDDPHMLLAGRITPPILGCPGSMTSGQFASYSLPVDVSLLDLNQGLWLELILSEPSDSLNGFGFVTMGDEGADGGAYARDLVLTSRCVGICMDLTDDAFVDYQDYTLIGAGCGRNVDSEILSTSPLPCIDRGYSRDGRVDVSDLVSWGGLMAHAGSGDIKNLCSIPMFREGTTSQVGSSFVSYGLTEPMAAPEAQINSNLLFLGKGKAEMWGQEFLGYEDLLFGFDDFGAASQEYILTSNQGQMRLIRGESSVLILGSDKGLCQLNGDAVVGPGQQTFQGKTVTLGVRKNGDDRLSGRPLRDVAFHSGFAYVVPVIVEDSDGVIYQAGAKLELVGEDYEIKQLYYDLDLAPVSDQSPNLRGLREIEVDRNGRVYLLNAHYQNSSDLLWAFDNAGALLSRHFLNRISGDPIENPVGLCYDTHSNRLYISSGVFDKALPSQSMLYGYARDSVLSEEALVPVQMITVGDLQHITDISSDRQGTLWITGFTLTNTPEHLDVSVLVDPEKRPLPGPRLVQVDTSGEGISQIDATSLYEHTRINLPTSVLYVPALSESVPVALWKFDELGGTTANDAAGGNNGAIYGATSTPGIIDGGLQFDGTDDYVDCGNSPELVPDAMTLSLWLNPDAQKGFLVSKSRTGVSNKDYESSLSRYGVKVTIGGEGNVADLYYTGSLPMQQWLHIAFSYGEGVLSVYINGVLEASKTYDFTVTDKGHSLSVGGGNTSDRFKGKIDNVGIYDVVLSEDEILGLFEEGQ